MTERVVSGLCAVAILGFGIAANLHGTAAWIVYPAAGVLVGWLAHKSVRG